MPAFGLVAKITASASRGEKAHQEVLTASVERAVEIGADGIVAMIPFAPENEPDVIRLVGELGENCGRWGMPFIAEAEYPNAYYGDQDYAESWGLPYLKRSARLCVELGADIVKSNWPGSGDAFAEIVDCANAPVVVAGGSADLRSRSARAVGGGSRSPAQSAARWVETSSNTLIRSAWCARSRLSFGTVAVPQPPIGSNCHPLWTQAEHDLSLATRPRSSGDPGPPRARRHDPDPARELRDARQPSSARNRHL